ARMLDEWSAALETLEYTEALDDPLVMADHDAVGRCLVGKVTKVDLEHREIKPGRKNATQVPLVSLRLEGATRLLRAEGVIWAEDPRVVAEIRELRNGEAILAVMEGHKGGERVPRKGASTLFASMSIFGGLRPRDPEGVPWTHRSPT